VAADGRGSRPPACNWWREPHKGEANQHGGRLAEAEGRQTCAVGRLGEAAAGLARVRRARRRERRLASFFLRRIYWSTRLDQASPSLPPEIHVWISQGQFGLFTKVNGDKYKEYDKI
jgi:hypothetical protein